MISHFILLLTAFALSLSSLIISSFLSVSFLLLVNVKCERVLAIVPERHQYVCPFVCVYACVYVWLCCHFSAHSFAKNLINSMRFGWVSNKFLSFVNTETRNIILLLQFFFFNEFDHFLCTIQMEEQEEKIKTKFKSKYTLSMAENVKFVHTKDVQRTNRIHWNEKANWHTYTCYWMTNSFVNGAIGILSLVNWWNWAKINHPNIFANILLIWFSIECKRNVIGA